MSVFTQAELDAWERDGYIVLKEAVSKAQCDAVVDAIWEFLEMDPDEPSTWYSLPPWHARTGMVEMYHHQSMWDNRQEPRIHAAFSQLFGTEKLLLRIVDRVNMNPPVREEHAYEGFIHWDFEPHTWPIPLMVQGVLLLRDTSAEQGGFQCVPGSHLQVDKILAAQKEGANPRNSRHWGLGSAVHPGRDRGSGNLAHGPAARQRPQPDGQSPGWPSTLRCAARNRTIRSTERHWSRTGAGGPPWIFGSRGPFRLIRAIWTNISPNRHT